MANQFKFVLNRDGVKELLKSSELQNECRNLAEKVRAAAGEGYVVEDRNYPERSGAAVYPETTEANFDNLKNNTLEKAFRVI